MIGIQGKFIAFLACVGTLFALTMCSGGSEGTVIDKAEQGVYAYGCQSSAMMSGPVAVPVWGACSGPECWRLVVRDSSGGTFQPCVSREQYDHSQLGTFWRERTDW